MVDWIWFFDPYCKYHVGLSQPKEAEGKLTKYLFRQLDALCGWSYGNFRLVLETGFVLDSENTFYVPSFSRNLISIARLVGFDFSFLFENSTFSIFKNKVFVGGGYLVDCLYKIKLDSTYECNYSIMHVDVGIKRSLINENSSMLWHRRLGHISIERIKRLVNDGVLKTLDFTDFGTCVDYIKGKQTNKTTKGAKRS